MKHHFILFTALLLSPLAALHAADPVTIPVDSPAMLFSPGNWTGDAGRSGKLFRQTWNAGAYVRVTWETTNPKPTAKLLLDLHLSARLQRLEGSGRSHSARARCAECLEERDHLDPSTPRRDHRS